MTLAIEGTCKTCGNTFVDHRNRRRLHCSAKCYRGSRNPFRGQLCAGLDCLRPATSTGLCTDHHRQAKRVEKAGELLRVCHCGQAIDVPYGRYCSTECRKVGIQRKRRSEFTLAYEARRWVDVLAILKKKSQPDEHGCWVWIRKPLANGYAQIRIPGRRMYAHRVAVEAKLGTRLSPDMPVHHKCANRRCINPDHLELVTHAQNVAEMLARQALLAEISRLRALLDGAGIAHGSPDLTDVPQSNAVTTRKAY